MRLSFLTGRGERVQLGEDSGFLPEASVSLGVQVSVQLIDSPELGGWGEIVEVGFLGKQVTSPSSLGLGWVGLMRSLQGRCAGFGLEGRQT